MCAHQQTGTHHFCSAGTQQCCAGGLQHAWADRAKRALMPGRARRRPTWDTRLQKEKAAPSVYLSLGGQEVTRSHSSRATVGHLWEPGVMSPAEGLVGLMVPGTGFCSLPISWGLRAWLPAPALSQSGLPGRPPSSSHTLAVQGAGAEVHDSSCSAACRDPVGQEEQRTQSHS